MQATRNRFHGIGERNAAIDSHTGYFSSSSISDTSSMATLSRLDQMIISRQNRVASGTSPRHRDAKNPGRRFGLETAKACPAPSLSLIDWEFYGAAPRGYDAAMLLMLASKDPELHDRLEKAFAEDLNTRSGLIARLYTIASRLKRMEEGKSDPRYYRKMEREAERLLRM